MYRLIIFLTLLVQSSIVFSNAYMVEIKANSVKERSAIASIIHIDSVLDNRLYSIVHKSDLKQLRKHHEDLIISIEAIDKKALYNPLSNEYEYPHGDEAFHTYEELVEKLNELVNNYPHIASIESIGKSVEERDILSVKVGIEPKDTQEKKSIVLMGTHHAREHVSTEIPLRFLIDLLEQEASDELIKKLLENINIYVIPMVNPDGAMHDIKGRDYKWWRKNRKENYDGSYGVDLNRNYSYGWGTGGSSSNPSSNVYMGEEPFSEPETKAVRDFFIAHQEEITMALSFHTFSELILYPWGGKDEGVGGKDEELYKKMAQDMAKMNGYEPMQSSDLYIASGDTCDYLYGELSIYCFTFELSPKSMWGGGFYPGADILDEVYDDNYEPLLYLLRHVKNPLAAIE